MRVASMVFVLVLVATCLSGAFADVLVFRDGTFEEGTIKSVTAESVTLQVQYGELPYPLERIYWYHSATPDRPGLEYYWAGMKLLELHKKYTAQKLFEKAGRFDKRYREMGAKAIQDYSPSRSTDSASRLRPPAMGEFRSGRPVYKVECKLCGGSGEVEYTIQGMTKLDDEYYFPTGVG